MILRYAIAVCVPAVLIVLGAGFGGYLPLLALLWLTLLAVVADPLLPEPEPATEDVIWGDRLSAALGAVHLLLIPVLLFGLENQGSSFGAQVALFLAVASFMGQVSHPVAHELIHRRDRRLRALGIAVYSSLLYGHHASAHRFVHHVHVGTRADPATPEPGESFWAYVPRAWLGNLAAGWEAECKLLAAQGHKPLSLENPYWVYAAGALLTLGLCALISGALGVVVFLALAGLVHLQMLLSDYVQHYGLHRLTLPDGGVEPIGPHHSWNAPGGFSALLMLNAGRHGEHHLSAARPFYELRAGEKPVLPHAMPVMAMAALFPELWRGLMDRRAVKVMEAAQARLGVSPEPVRSGDMGGLRQAFRG